MMEQAYVAPEMGALHSEGIKQLIKALVLVQKSSILSQKDGDNIHFKSKYSTLTKVWNCIREPLTSNGFCITQIIGHADKGMSLTTLLLHESGEWLKSVAPLRPARDGVQDFGSYITYMRRYAICSLIGVVPTDDDDGESDAKVYREKKVEKKEEKKLESTKSFNELKEVLEELNINSSRLIEYLKNVIKEKKAKDNITLTMEEAANSALVAREKSIPHYKKFIA